MLINPDKFIYRELDVSDVSFKTLDKLVQIFVDCNIVCYVRHDPLNKTSTMYCCVIE